jgi:demethylmenaquinone methyltransferase/2-methoxy-6-polyprenyl-1,4-benzoquinol methylase
VLVKGYILGVPRATGRTDWLHQGEAKREAVRQMFAEIAPSYDRVNGLLSLNLHHRWRSVAVDCIQVKPGDLVADICCGTGDFATEVANRGAHVLGLDFCLPMLDLATQKGVRHAAWGLADACTLPVATASMDAVTVGWGLRNVPDLDAALAEIARVLKPGGRFACLDMARPEAPVVGWFSERAFHVVTPLVGRLVGHADAYQYLPKSAERFVSRAVLRQKLEKAGLHDVRERSFMFGNISLTWGVKR